MPPTPAIPPLWRKLNLGGHTRLVVLDAPASFEPALADLHGREVRRRLDGPASFVLAFACRCADRDARCRQMTEAAEGDAVLWLAYPKGTSRLKGEFNRDSGWAVFGAAGFEPVRQVAIDDDWTALRFRRVAHIATMTRAPEGAISAAGRSKAARDRGTQGA